MNCPSCGNQNPTGAQFCSRCENPLGRRELEKDPIGNICPDTRCNRPVSLDMLFCPYCGESLETEIDGETEEEAEEESHECPDCGEELPDDDEIKFCPYCRCPLKNEKSGEVLQGDTIEPGLGDTLCPNCEAPVRKEWDACPGCGIKLLPNEMITK